MFNSGGMSAADVAAVMGSNRDNGWGGDGAWWVWIVLFALFGWGGNGWGGNGTSQSSFTDAAIQRGFDNQAVISKLDGINSGICSLGYDQLSQMNNLNTNIMQTGFGLQNSINGVSAQLANCCCENREAIAQVRYDMATNTCALQNTMSTGFSQLDRTINDKFCELEMRDMQRTIDEQQSLIQSLNLAQSQANQNNYLVNALRPSPVPSYQVPNPYAGFGYGQCGTSCNTGCGC